MKNFIESGAVGCIILVDYSPANRPCTNARKSFFTYVNLLLFYTALRLQIRQLASRCYKALSCLILSMLVIFSIKAQQDLSYSVHANIIYRITKYIEWPDYNNSGDFVIGIVGNTPLYDELESFIANKTVGSRKIVLKKMSASADSYSCHILFISEGKSRSLKRIAELTKESAVLIISETSDQSLKGSCINFVIVNEHLKLEINKTNIEDRNLNIASELLRLGTIVK